MNLDVSLFDNDPNQEVKIIFGKKSQLEDFCKDLKYYCFYKDICYRFSEVDVEYFKNLEKYSKFDKKIREYKSKMLHSDGSIPNETQKNAFIRKMLYRWNFHFIFKMAMKCFTSFVQKINTDLFPFIANSALLIDLEFPNPSERMQCIYDQTKTMLTNAFVQLQIASFDNHDQG